MIYGLGSGGFGWRVGSVDAGVIGVLGLPEIVLSVDHNCRGSVEEYLNQDDLVHQSSQALIE